MHQATGIGPSRGPPRLRPTWLQHAAANTYNPESASRQYIARADQHPARPSKSCPLLAAELRSAEGATHLLALVRPDEVALDHSAELALGPQHDKLISLDDPQAAAHAQLLPSNLPITNRTEPLTTEEGWGEGRTWKRSRATLAASSSRKASDIWQHPMSSTNVAVCGASFSEY